MKAFLYSGLLIFIIGCNATENKQNDIKVDSIVIIAPSVSAEREQPSKKPVAAYAMPIDDGMGNLNNWKFAVNIYETTKTFNYKVNVQYKEIRSTEIIQIPNFNTMPEVSIKPGKTGLDCMIGFNDAKGLFKEYIQVSVKNEQLKVKKVNSYAVRSYQRKLN